MVMNIVKNMMAEQAVEEAARKLGLYVCLPFTFDEIRDDKLLSVFIVVTALDAIM